ncbi:MAG: hypothetical protein L6435_12985 [Anaerolineae bacterium]|nr:hypothetical protein [Anaerolineae bacterium]
MERQGFHCWAWLVVFMLGGLLIVFGGAQDVMLFFSPELALVPSWYQRSASRRAGLRADRAGPRPG